MDGMLQNWGIRRKACFEFHGKKHILRVLLLGLIYFYNGEPALNLLDKKILIYFALLHDLGRTNDEKDDAPRRKVGPAHHQGAH